MTFYRRVIYHNLKIIAKKIGKDPERVAMSIGLIMGGSTGYYIAHKEYKNHETGFLKYFLMTSSSSLFGMYIGMLLPWVSPYIITFGPISYIIYDFTIQRKIKNDE